MISGSPEAGNRKMSGRSRRMYGGVPSSSQHDVRVKKRDVPLDDDENKGGAGDGKSKSDDVRISKLTRLLARLDSEESFSTICGQIESALKEEENQRYVSRCFQCLCPAFQEVFKGLSGLSWEVAGSKRFAQLLATICLSMESHSVKFFQWLVDIIVRASRGSQAHISSAAYVMESVSIRMIGLIDTSDVIIFIKCIYDVLEDVCNPKVFRVLGAIFVKGTNYTDSSWRNPHFHDFIDMVVGWMVDVQQSTGQYASCTELLENSKQQFMKDVGFLITLMSQLLEDLEKVIKKVQETSKSDSEEFRKILQFVRAFKTLLSLECPLDKMVVSEYSDRLVASTLQFIRMCEPHQTMDQKYRYELLSTVNKALYFGGGITSQSTTKYYRAQLKLGTTNSSYMKWPKLFLNGFLESVTVWVEGVVSQTQLSEDIVEICDILLDLIEDMQQFLPPHDQHYVMKLIFALMRTRNVNLLQKTYAWLIKKLPSKEMPQSGSVEEDEAVLFVLMGLADIIGNKSGAMLSLWVLEPAIFEILVEISNMKIHLRTRQCTLDLLKTHCHIHSHFVSSIASTGTFNTDSPGSSRFLPALMDFWVAKLQDLDDPQSEWLMEWIFSFLQGSNSYATLLYQAKPDFFERLLIVITQKSSFIMTGAEILYWICCESDYTQIEDLNLLIQERLLVIILDEKLPEMVRNRYKNIVYNMSQLLVIPGVVFVEDCVEPDVSYKKEDDNVNLTLALISTEFNMFLYELLLGNSHTIPQLGYSGLISETNNSVLAVAADHLIRMKLKTPIGKPQDFFAQLLLVFKRSRLAKTSMPIWKLHFVFELEKKFQLWTHGSAVDDTELTEHVKQFYTMNKSPFLEWLKKIRLEIMESCILSREYSLAYFNAALMCDTQKMEYVLYQIGDLAGLRGVENLAALYYLEGKFEQALSFFNNQDNQINELQSEIRQNSEKMLQDCCNELQQWPETGEEGSISQLTQMFSSVKPSTLVEFQLQNQNKLDVSVIGTPDILQFLTLPVIQRLHFCLQNLPETTLNSERKQTLERIKMDKMVEAGNLDYVRNWLLSKDIDLDAITTDDDLCNLSLTSVPVDTLKVFADYYARKLDYDKSVILYNILRELVAGSIDSELAIKVTSSLTSRIQNSEEFFAVFSRESLSHCGKQETIASLHQVAIHSFPEAAGAWLSYGDYNYSLTSSRNNRFSEETNALKQKTVECYEKYIQLSHHQAGSTPPTKISSHFAPYSPKIVVMARLLQLFREGFLFDFETTINNEDWLLFTAEIAQIPAMRSFIVEKYPDQVALFFTSYDSHAVSNKRAVRRRNLFDLTAYTYVDTSEEPLSSSLVLSNLSQLEKSLGGGGEVVDKTSQCNFHFRSDLNIPGCATVFTQELLHVASSMEDMWVWSLERIALDWTRRLTYLKKECSRSLSSEKVQAFVQPVLNFLNSLFAKTVESQSLVDVHFVNRHSVEIQKYLDQISSSHSLEDVASAMNSLLKYSERFGILSNNKLPLNLYSSKLSDSEFFSAPDFSICLPGQPSHIKISSVYHVIHALPTKTKPKRIRILANNGKYYDYLVKGTENLNIDCGVMQLLKISQSFFKLPTRTYSITPLGKRGGLIQIVPDAIPLFTLYKKHLQRNKCMEKTSEMFWRRMNSLGYDDRSSIAAQREVYETLCQETSCDLITRELLLSAQTPTQWLDSVQAFTRDCSIGSAVGYLLGIGDRHLDNMLVNVNHGKFIHVDFSIIFGRGASLRVPEKVPFRLTQNLTSVLQYPGTSGSFSVMMQDILNSFQEYRSTAVHLIKNIAFCHMYDEDSPVDLTQILISEVESAVKLFLCRSSQYLSLIQALRTETLEAADEPDSIRRVSRKMNRWRRMLVNLNTVLQFICSSIHTENVFGQPFGIVQSRWVSLFQTSLEMGMELQPQSAEKFLALLDTTEIVLKDVQAVLIKENEYNLNVMKLHDANVQVIDMNRVEVLVKYAEMNIQTYTRTSTVKKLIEEAMNVDNLAQMYEGWTPWV